MNIRTTARRVAVAAAVAAPIALMASPAFAQEAAEGIGSEGITAENAATTISGVAWLDQNSDGVRDSGEPAFAGHTMYLVGGSNTSVKTDANGRYTFTGLQEGTSYRIGSADRSLLDGHGWSPAQSWRPNGSDFSQATGEASFQAGEQNADSGLVLVRNDYKTTQIIVELPGHTSKPTYQVGDVVDILGSATVSGNANDQFGAKLTLPDGLRKLERLGGMPEFMAEDEPNEVTGMFYDRRTPGFYEFLGARVIVEKPIDAADIKLEVWKGVFDRSDQNLSNDNMTASFTAVAAPEPTTQPTTPAPTTEPTTTQPAPTTTTEPAPTTTTTTAPAIVPVSQNTKPLASTGASALGLIGLGGSMLAGGGAALWGVRRKKA